MEKAPNLSPEAARLEKEIRDKLTTMDDRISLLRLLEGGAQVACIPIAIGGAYSFVTGEDYSFYKELGDLTLNYLTGVSKLREKCEKEKETYISSLIEKMKVGRM